jgi:serine/threonine protein kinase
MNPGDLVTPNIRLTRLLGEGGMGSVWAADHLTLQTQVVVKFIQGAHTSNADIVSRFQREAALAAQARSPHVVQVFDHGLSTHGTPFIAMEYLHGEDLGAYLEREGVAPVAVYADWLRQIAKGLTRTHAQGIIHRDIKPENLFLSEADGEITVKLLDFGVAKGDPASGFASTTTGAVVGTVYYMSPEQALGSNTIDFRTDLWALGVVSYLALTGNRAFVGSSIVQLLSAIIAGKFRPPSHWRPELGPQVDAWMERVLSTNPEHRHASAKAMAEAFVAAVQVSHGPLKVLSDSQPEPIRPLNDSLSDQTLAASVSPAPEVGAPAARDASPMSRRRLRWSAGVVVGLVAAGVVVYAASAPTTDPAGVAAAPLTSSQQGTTDVVSADTVLTDTTTQIVPSSTSAPLWPVTAAAPSAVAAPLATAGSATRVPASLGLPGAQRPRPGSAVWSSGVSSNAVSSNPTASSPSLPAGAANGPSPSVSPLPGPAPKSPLKMTLE